MRDKVEREVETNMASDRLSTMQQGMQVNGDHEQREIESVDSSDESDEKMQIKSQMIIDQVFSYDPNFFSRENYNLTLKGCTFMENFKFTSYKSATVHLVDCHFHKKFLIESFAKIDVKIENGTFRGNRIILHDESSVRLKENTYAEEFYLLAWNRITLNIENGLFTKGKRLQCFDETVLTLVKNIYEGKVLSEFRGVAKMDVHRCCFKLYTEFTVLDDANVTLNESDFNDGIYLRGSRAEIMAKKCHFNKAEFDFNGRVLFSFTNNRCRSEICFRGFEETNAIVEKCIFDGEAKFYFYDKTSMKFIKNDCKHEINFKRWDEFNLIDEKNSFYRPNMLRSQIK